MALPISTTLADVDAICGYLITKPTGATAAEAKAILDAKVLDGRKISAMKFWGFYRRKWPENTRNGAGPSNRKGQRGASSRRTEGRRCCRAAISCNGRAFGAQKRTDRVGNGCCGALARASSGTKCPATTRFSNDQAVCFFQIAEGADLGKLVVGRKGQPTRFEFDETTARKFAESDSLLERDLSDQGTAWGDFEVIEGNGTSTDGVGNTELRIPEIARKKGNRVFITHGKNLKIFSNR